MREQKKVRQLRRAVRRVKLIVHTLRAAVRSLGVIVPLLTAFITACSGIPMRGADGSVHHIIIGVGVVSVPAVSEEPSMRAVRTHTLGLDIKTGPMQRISAGYSFSAEAIIPDGARNICAQISHYPFGRMTVEPCPGIETTENVQSN